MKSLLSRWLKIVAIAAVGGAVTFVVLLILRLFAFQSDWVKTMEAYRLITSEYVTPVAAERLTDGALKGMLAVLDDPYTAYLEHEDANEFADKRSGEFAGIGADIRVMDGKVEVISPVAGSPADKAGLLPGDLIVKVNEVELEGMSLDEAADYLRGAKGTEAKLEIRRPGEERPFALRVVRDEIPTRSVYTSVLAGGVYVWRISEFIATTGTEVKEAIRQTAADSAARGIILDLRRNPGGSVREAIDVSSQFVPKGGVIASFKERNGKADPILSTGGTSDLHLPVVVLVDEGTASAAEITAAALHESAGIPLVGMRTFGKGIGQTVHRFTDGSFMKYTTFEIVTPQGKHFHRIGLEPDYSVARPDYVKLPVLQLSNQYQLGDMHPEIGLAQQYVSALGYSVAGRMDGVFDERTRDALDRFQADVTIARSGRLDSQTAPLLVEKLRELIRNNDLQLDKALEVLRERM